MKKQVLLKMMRIFRITWMVRHFEKSQQHILILDGGGTPHYNFRRTITKQACGVWPRRGRQESPQHVSVSSVLGNPSTPEPFCPSPLCYQIANHNRTLWTCKNNTCQNMYYQWWKCQIQRNQTRLRLDVDIEGLGIELCYNTKSIWVHFYS
jgi:hypothetical protein